MLQRPLLDPETGEQQWRKTRGTHTRGAHTGEDGFSSTTGGANDIPPGGESVACFRWFFKCSSTALVADSGRTRDYGRNKGGTVQTRNKNLDALPHYEKPPARLSLVLVSARWRAPAPGTRDEIISATNTTHRQHLPSYQDFPAWP